MAHVDRRKVQNILREIIWILKKNPLLLNDKEVQEWIMMIYGIALVYGDSATKQFFKEIRVKLLPQLYH